MTASTLRIVLVGFGSAGQGLARILARSHSWLCEQHACDLRIVGVATRSRGTVYTPSGLDPEMLLEYMQQTNSFQGHPDAMDWDTTALLERAEADVLVEVSPTALQTAEPATQYIHKAFSRGWHVVTANKGPVALHYNALRHTADTQGLYFGIEGTVMSGTPALRMCWSNLAGGRIDELRGIVNGTTNYILTQMERGLSYEAALIEAQRLGYAEADPSGDVEGHDAAAKAVILANVLMGASLKPDDVQREGMSRISSQMVSAAQQAQERWKLIARVWRDGGRVHAQVQPMRLPISHPLAGVSGATNALTATTEWLGDVTIIGPGAGSEATGFALLSDLLAIGRPGEGPLKERDL